mmetsp:Transcript_38481/g.53596  ORF Transcript_38481/g.53596 Transcript_38481/m.53596 type:complete len:115 (-) Transcript_38481:452-796(-)
MPLDSKPQKSRAGGETTTTSSSTLLFYSSRSHLKHSSQQRFFLSLFLTNQSVSRLSKQKIEQTKELSLFDHLESLNNSFSPEGFLRRACPGFPSKARAFHLCGFSLLPYFVFFD